MISISAQRNFAISENFWLEDIKENKMIDLTQTSFYSFEASPDDDVNRFLLHFNNTVLGTKENLSNEALIYCYDKKVYVIVPEFATGIIKVYDMMGREIISESINNSIHGIRLGKSAFYIVKVLYNNKIKVEKIFIK